MFPQDRADIFFREISRLVLATSSWSRAPITSAYQQTLGSLRLVRFSRSLGRVEARRLYGSEKRAEGFCVRCKGGAVGSPRYVCVSVCDRKETICRCWRRTLNKRRVFVIFFYVMSGERKYLGWVWFPLRVSSAIIGRISSDFPNAFRLFQHFSSLLSVAACMLKWTIFKLKKVAEVILKYIKAIKLKSDF